MFAILLFDDGAPGLTWPRSAALKLLMPRGRDERGPLASIELQGYHRDRRCGSSRVKAQPSTSRRANGGQPGQAFGAHMWRYSCSSRCPRATDSDLCHTFTVATPHRLEPLGRRQAQHLPVRVIATSGASWPVACQVRHTVTEVEISIVQIAQRVMGMQSPGSIE